MVIDPVVIQKLEDGYNKLQNAPECKSLLKKYLTRQVLDALKTRRTSMGATLLDVVQSGFANLDSGIGVYAPDAESYTLFNELFDPIIDEYHKGFGPNDYHPPTNYGDMNQFVNLDPESKYIVSTRVRCGRSITDYPFNPCMTEAQYKDMETRMSTVLAQLDGELKGNYYPLTGMSKEVQNQLINEHLLFKEGDRFLREANACRFWPTGRGIFLNDARTFMIWVGEEDHLRIISMQKGGDLRAIYSRMINGVQALERAQMSFSRDARLGWLTFCPTNLGTSIRASVHIALPKLGSNRQKLESIASKYHLQVRGTRGEHTESEGGVYDISNKRRLGLTENDAVMEMQNGIMELIREENNAN